MIYKGAEGTFVRAQKTSGLFKEYIHLEVEEWSTLGFLTKQIQTESLPLRGVCANEMDLFSYSQIKGKSSCYFECSVFANRNTLSYHHAISPFCKWLQQTGCQREGACQFCAEVLWRVHLGRYQHISRNLNTAEPRRRRFLIHWKIPSGINSQSQHVTTSPARSSAGWRLSQMPQKRSSCQSKAALQAASYCNNPASTPFR